MTRGSTNLGVSAFAPLLTRGLLYSASLAPLQVFRPSLFGSVSEGSRCNARSQEPDAEGSDPSSSNAELPLLSSVLVLAALPDVGAGFRGEILAECFGDVSPAVSAETDRRQSSALDEVRWLAGIGIWQDPSDSPSANFSRDGMTCL